MTFVVGLSHFQKPSFLLCVKSCLCPRYTTWSVAFILECGLATVYFPIVGVWPYLRSNRGSLLSEGHAVACQQL